MTSRITLREKFQMVRRRRARGYEITRSYVFVLLTGWWLCAPRRKGAVR